MYVRDAWTRYVQLMEDQLPRWSLMAHSLMLRPVSAIWKTRYVLGETGNLPIITRCCTAWGKFKKLLPILMLKHVPLKPIAKCSMLVSILPCYMVVKRGHHPLLIYNDFVETTEQWLLDLRRQT
ncbi:hypothetical protein DPMN_036323 [Dreissena polymorpha]|uniref:Uncharacterized protein n=1 Tax=Dreissena polymorpha TaxID=45954 RepID=A0A9D4M8Y2_DREPO|nr:hypothetical protein DPMN_036323 [Dreissena polymorpha]